ncbi:MAG: alpha-galactosidase [Colwelliaceae bacterium]|nr:alpha-galactosidase [Colwelliaceae bacterium]
MKLNDKAIYSPEYNIEKIITIETKTAALVLAVCQEKSLLTCHFGGKLDNPESYIATGKILKGEELPKSISAFGGSEHNATLRITHADQMISTELIYTTHVIKKIDNNRVETIITLKDKLHHLHVELHYLAYAAEDIIECWTVFENNEAGVITLHDYASFELAISNQTADYHMTSFFGLWEREASIQEEKLTFGIKTLENNFGTWSSFGFNPAFLLSTEGKSHEDFGEVISGAYAWTGSWKIDFNYNFNKLAHDSVQRQLLTVSATNQTVAADYHLNQGKSLTTPKFILNYSNQGTGKISRNFHQWSRQYNLRDGDSPRPIVLNSWEGAHFDYNEDVLIDMMDGLVKMGGEMFVLDDGWFGENEFARDSIYSGLGDWQVNRSKLPNGLEYLIEQAGKRDLAFGIWFEPEMVNPNSELFKQHPEWVIKQPERDNILYRQQLVLDLSNPLVQEHVYQSVANILEQHPGISYIKWDCNRSFTNFGSQFLSKNNQSHLWYDYVQGLYSVYHRIEKNFPKVILQVCASGGGRIDFGSLKYHHEFWASDNTDALQRVYIQWGLSHIYPAIACANHVSICPNHQTGRTLPLKFRFDVAMSGRLGLELKPSDLSETSLNFVQEAVKSYKLIREVVSKGDLYRIMSPYASDYSILSYLCEKKQKLVMFAYKLNHLLGQLMPTVKLKGISPSKSYLIEEINLRNNQPSHCLQNGVVMSGSDLISKGLRLNLNEEYDSAVITFIEHLRD